MNNSTTVENSTVSTNDNSAPNSNGTNSTVDNITNNTATSVDNNTNSTIPSVDNNTNSTIAGDYTNSTNSTVSLASYDEDSIFTFDEALKLHQKIKITKCTKDEDCPYTETCTNNNQCMFSLTCSSDKLHCVDSYEFKDDIACTVDQECISNSCVNNVCSSSTGIINCNLLGDQVNCGLRDKAPCSQDSECLSNKCNNGTCDSVDKEIKNMFTKPVITFTCIMAVLILLCLCCCIHIFSSGRKNKKLVKAKKVTPKNKTPKREVDQVEP